MIPRMAGGDAFVENEAAVQRSATPSRRKSHGGEWRQSLAPPAALKSDPRPITEKAYTNSCINSLLQYLVSSGYEHPVSRKTLARPSGRDFSQIVSFLLRRIDPTFNDGSQKFEDEVAMAFKSLGYPYPISKTALVAAGSPHTWPTLLAALTWLIELLSCEDSQEEEDLLKNDDNGEMTSLEEIESRSEKSFFRYLTEAYVAFLSADDPQYEALEEALVEYFEKDNLKIEGEFQRVTETNVQIQEEITQLLRNGEELPELKQRRENYATDLEKFYDLVKKLEEHKATLSKKVEERTADLTKREEDLQQITARIDILKSQIQNQEFSVEDVRRMQKEKTRLEESIARAAGAKDEQNKALWEISTELSQQVDQLQAIVDTYNRRTSDLRLGPEIADEAMYELKLNTDLSKDYDPVRLFNGTDVRGTVLPMIISLRCDYAEKHAQAKNDVLEILDRNEVSEKTLADVSECVKALELNSKRCEEICVRESEANEAALSFRLKEVDAVETKIASLRDPVALEAAISKYLRQCSQLEELRQKHQSENVSKKKAIQEELDMALRVLAEQKEYVQNQFKDLGDHIQNKMD